MCKSPPSFSNNSQLTVVTTKGLHRRLFDDFTIKLRIIDVFKLASGGKRESWEIWKAEHLKNNWISSRYVDKIV